MSKAVDKKISISSEDYLEAALRLKQAGQRIRVSTLAVAMNVSMPAATKALNELKERGLVLKEVYGDVTLTDEGLKVAETVYAKHTFLFDFLRKIGVSEQTAQTDCCKIEHILSDETICCIKKLCDTL